MTDATYEDVLAALGLTTAPTLPFPDRDASAVPDDRASPAEAEVLDALGWVARSVDELADDCPTLGLAELSLAVASLLGRRIVVERDGLSIRHPARIVLVGTGNPEEGELRPQLLDRFGLSIEVKTPEDLPTRVEVVKRRDAFESDSAGFVAAWAKEDAKLRKRITAARERLGGVAVADAMLTKAAQLCMALGTDGLRGELTLVRGARALAAIEGAKAVTEAHLKRVAPLALRHRLRRNPLDDSGSTVRVERALAECFAP